MGYYIQVPAKKGKAELLVILHDAETIDKPNSWQDIPEGKGLICMVDNGPF